MNGEAESQQPASEALVQQVEATKRLADAVEEQNELLRMLVDAVAYGCVSR